MGRLDTPALRALQRAIDLCGGSRRELARRVCDLGYPHRDPPGALQAGEERPPAFTSQRMDNWFNRDGSIPLEVAPFISLAVGGKVTVRQLCPDYMLGWAILQQLLAVHDLERESA